MDFDDLDLRSSEGEEYWVHLRIGDTLLFADMDKQERPCRVKVASVSEPSVEEALKAVERTGIRQSSIQAQYGGGNRNQRKEVENRLDAIERETEGAITHLLTVMVRDWENIEKGGRPLPFSKEALADMAQPKAPLYRLATALAEDAASAQSPFASRGSD